MKNVLIILALLFIQEAIAVCSSPISRSNPASLAKLTASKYNTDLNTAYTRANDLPGDCISSESVTTSQISNGTIVDADISASALISHSKMATPNYVISTGGSGTFSTSSTTYVDVTNLTATITTTGRPVQIFLVPNSTHFTDNPGIKISSSTASTASYLKILRDSTDVAEFTLQTTATGSTATALYLPPGVISAFEVPAAGTYTYKVQIKVTVGTYLAEAIQAKLVVREL